jgi:hypothetical protein
MQAMQMQARKALKLQCRARIKREAVDMFFGVGHYDACSRATTHLGHLWVMLMLCIDMV